METQTQTNTTFPRDGIDPAKKDIEWGKTFAKAAFYTFQDFVPRTCFYNAADKYEENRLYAIGSMPINKYKKLMGVDEQTNLTYLNIDWSPINITGTIRDIIISKMCQQEYDIVCTPIDPLAKSDLEDYYNQLKAKIAVRQAMQQQNPQLAQHPILSSTPGEPMDDEELQMRIQFGEQFNRSKDAEQAIKLGMYENGEKVFRRGVFEDLFDNGVAGYKEWLGDDGKPRFRKCMCDAVMTNFCRWADFRDLRYAGEVVDVDLVDLAQVKNEDGSPRYTDEELERLAINVAGKWGNPTIIGRSTNFFKGFDSFKVKVFDLQFYSWNDLVWREGKDDKGNVMFKEDLYYKRNRPNRTSKRIKVVYEIKWIVGTEYAYDFRLKKDSPRSSDPKKVAETKLDYHFFAYNFYEMRAKGMMERLIPLIDQYMMDVYKIQNIKLRYVNSGWWIDLDALESVALKQGGAAMTPEQLLQMFYDTGVLVGRSKDVMNDHNPNYKPIIPIQNTIANEIQAFAQDMMMLVGQMKAMVGLNDATDASTINPKTLNGATGAMNDNTNNALYPMQFAEKQIYEELANNVLQRTCQGIQKKGAISGYAPALNSNLLQFIQVSKDLPLREYGIMIEEKTTDDRKAMIIQGMQQDKMAGLIDDSDIIMILNTYNIKQAQQMLAYKVKKSKQDMQQNEQAKIQSTVQGQQQSAQQTQQNAQQLSAQDHQQKMDEINLTKQWDLKIKGMDVQAKAAMNTENNQVKVIGNAVNNLPEGALMPPQQQQGLPPQPQPQEAQPEEQMA